MPARLKILRLFQLTILVMVVLSIGSMFFIDLSVKIPTKWDGNGEPSQFVSPLIGLFIVPAIVSGAAFFTMKKVNWSVIDRNQALSLFGIVTVVNLIVLALHGFIVWGALARS